MSSSNETNQNKDLNSVRGAKVFLEPSAVAKAQPETDPLQVTDEKESGGCVRTDSQQPPLTENEMQSGGEGQGVDHNSNDKSSEVVTDGVIKLEAGEEAKQGGPSRPAEQNDEKEANNNNSKSIDISAENTSAVIGVCGAKVEPDERSAVPTCTTSPPPPPPPMLLPALVLTPSLVTDLMGALAPIYAMREAPNYIPTELIYRTPERELAGYMRKNSKVFAMRERKAAAAVSTAAANSRVKNVGGGKGLLRGGAAGAARPSSSVAPPRGGALRSGAITTATSSSPKRNAATASSLGNAAATTTTTSQTQGGSAAVRRVTNSATTTSTKTTLGNPPLTTMNNATTATTSGAVGGRGAAAAASPSRMRALTPMRASFTRTTTATAGGSDGSPSKSMQQQAAPPMRRAYSAMRLPNNAASTSSTQTGNTAAPTRLGGRSPMRGVEKPSTAPSASAGGAPTRPSSVSPGPQLRQKDGGVGTRGKLNGAGGTNEANAGSRGFTTLANHSSHSTVPAAVGSSQPNSANSSAGTSSLPAASSSTNIRLDGPSSTSIQVGTEPTQDHNANNNSNYRSNPSPPPQRYSSALRLPPMHPHNNTTAGSSTVGHGHGSTNRSSSATAGGSSTIPEGGTAYSEESWDLSKRMEELLDIKSTNLEALLKSSHPTEPFTRSRSFTTGAAGSSLSSGVPAAGHIFGPFVRSSSQPAGRGSTTVSPRREVSESGGGTGYVRGNTTASHFVVPASSLHDQSTPPRMQQSQTLSSLRGGGGGTTASLIMRQFDLREGAHRADDLYAEDNGPHTNPNEWGPNHTQKSRGASVGANEESGAPLPRSLNYPQTFSRNSSRASDGRSGSVENQNNAAATDCAATESYSNTLRSCNNTQRFADSRRQGLLNTASEEENKKIENASNETVGVSIEDTSAKMNATGTLKKKDSFRAKSGPHDPAPPLRSLAHATALTDGSESATQSSEPCVVLSTARGDRFETNGNRRLSSSFHSQTHSVTAAAAAAENAPSRLGQHQTTTKVTTAAFPPSNQTTPSARASLSASGASAMLRHDELDETYDGPMPSDHIHAYVPATAAANGAPAEASPSRRRGGGPRLLPSTGSASVSAEGTPHNAGASLVPPTGRSGQQHQHHCCDLTNFTSAAKTDNEAEVCVLSHSQHSANRLSPAATTLSPRASARPVTAADTDDCIPTATSLAQRRGEASSNFPPTIAPVPQHDLREEY